MSPNLVVMAMHLYLGHKGHRGQLYGPSKTNTVALMGPIFNLKPRWSFRFLSAGNFAVFLNHQGLAIELHDVQ